MTTTTRRPDRLLRRVRLSALLEAIIALRAVGTRAVSRSGKAFAPINALIEVTYRCNLRCNFCHYLDIIEHKATPLGPVDEPTIEQLEETIAEVPRGGLISFAGGEAFVRREFRALLRRTSATHRTHVITNGTLLSDEVAAELVDLAPLRIWQRGFVLLCVSLQGLEDTNDRVVARPGSWAKTVRGVSAVVAAREAAGKSFPKINLKTVVSIDTVGELPEFVALASELGADVVSLMVEHSDDAHTGVISGDVSDDLIRRPVTSPSRIDLRELREQLIRAYLVAEESGIEIRTTPPNLPIDEFVAHYERDHVPNPGVYGCTSPWSRVGLMADGRFVACPYYRVGDVTDGGLAAAWNGPEMAAARREIRSTGIQPGCSGCCNLQYHGPLNVGLSGVDEASVTAFRPFEVPVISLSGATAPPPTDPPEPVSVTIGPRPAAPTA